MTIKPEELYTDKDKQQEYPQIYDGDELLAVVISFPLKEEDETIEVAVEETEPSINATEILSKGSVDLKILKKRSPEEEDEELNKLREKLKTSEEGGNLKEVDPINPITTANLLYNTSLSKLASLEGLTDQEINDIKNRLDIGKWSGFEIYDPDQDSDYAAFEKLEDYILYNYLTDDQKERIDASAGDYEKILGFTFEEFCEKRKVYVELQKLENKMEEYLEESSRLDKVEEAIDNLYLDYEFTSVFNSNKYDFEKEIDKIDARIDELKKEISK